MRTGMLARVRWPMIAGIWALGLGLASSPAGAQQAEPRRLEFGLTGGVARTSMGRGYNMGAAAVVATPWRPLDVRVEALFADWTGRGGNNVLALAPSLVLAPVRWERAAPYVLAGGGGYYESGAGMQVGYQLGLGLEIPVDRVSLLVESRMHSYRLVGAEGPPGATYAQDDRRTLVMPISFGIRF